jgi:hypothetical protein
MKSILQPLNE